MSSIEKNSNLSGAVSNSMHSTSQAQPLVNQVTQPTQIYHWNPDLNSTGPQLYFRPLALYNTQTKILTPIAAQPTAYQPSFQQLQQYVIVPPSFATTILGPTINNNLQNSNNNPARTANPSVGQTSDQNSVPPVPPVPPESSDQVSSSTKTKSEEVTAESTTNTSPTCVTQICMQVPHSQAASTSMDCKPLPKADKTQERKNARGESPNYKSDGGNQCKFRNDSLKHSCHVPGCRKVFNRPSLLKKHLRRHGGKKTVFCAHCDKGYTRKSQLCVHIKSHHNPEPNDESKDGNKIRGPEGKLRYFCRFPNCGRPFEHASTLKRHEDWHSGDKNKCGKEFSQKNVRRKPKRKHRVESARRQAQKERLTCRFEGCGRVYASVSNLNAHLKLHNDDRPYACRMCEKKYTFECFLRAHERSHRDRRDHHHHPASVMSSTDKSYDGSGADLASTYDITQVEEAEDQAAESSQSPDRLLDVAELGVDDFLSLDQQFSDLTADDTTTEPESMSTSKKRNEKPRKRKLVDCPCLRCLEPGGNNVKDANGVVHHPCPFPNCEKLYDRPSHLQRHVDGHNGKFNFFCQHCGRGFVRKDNWNEHLQRRSCITRNKRKNSKTESADGGPPYACPFDKCKEVYNVMKRLTVHLKSEHDFKPYVCAECEIEFAFKYLLLRHLPTHDVEKKFLCPHCKQYYSRMDTLKKHIRNVHKGAENSRSEAAE